MKAKQNTKTGYQMLRKWIQWTKALEIGLCLMSLNGQYVDRG
jgi:hypothetical protein